MKPVIISDNTKQWIEATKLQADRLTKGGRPGLSGLLMISVAEHLLPVIEDHELEKLVTSLARASLPKAEEKVRRL